MTNPAEPFRFDDRSGHYGAGQADLAPVSPVAAPRQPDRADGPVDPMGSSPDEPEGAPIARVERDGGAEVQAQLEASATIQTSATAPPLTGGGSAPTPTGEIAPIIPLTAAPEGQPAQTTTLTISGGMAVEGRTASADPEPLGSGAPITLLTPALTGALQEGPDGFAAIARQMDQTMGEMAARIGDLSPWSRDDDEDDTSSSPLMPDVEAFEDRFATLSEGLFGDDDADGSLFSRDPILDAQARIDDLLGRNLADDADATPTGGPATTALDDARARLDDLTDPVRSESEGPEFPSASAPLLAQLFDGDAAPSLASLGMNDRSERFGDLEDFVPDPSALALGPIGWDDLPDFG